MKIISVILLTLATTVALANPPVPPSVIEQIEPIYDSLGFFLKDNDVIAGEVHIAKVKQINLKGSKDEAIMLRGVLLFGDNHIPLQIIKPELEAFEADLIQLNDTEPRKDNLATPIGHISFKLKQLDKIHSVAMGELVISLQDENKSGRYRVLLNELTEPKSKVPSKPSDGNESIHNSQ